MQFNAIQKIPVGRYIGLILLCMAGLSARGYAQDGKSAMVDAHRPKTATGEVSGATSAKLQTIVTLKKGPQKLVRALQSIARQAGLKLSYSEQVIPYRTKVTINTGRLTAEQALWAILEETGYRFGISASGQLVLVKRQRPAPAARQETITGTVSDAQSGETLPGVNIKVKGTTTGAATDADGQYELEVESLQDTLVVSFVGYKTRQVPINGRTEIDVALQSQTISGEEMVVVGHGTQRRKDLTGSISSVSSEQIQSSTVTNLEGALQGKVAGVQVRQSGGALEGNFNVQIRGTGSTGNTQPLYVVDGVPLFSGSLSTINPKNIESIDILKDASATAIYGARAANGVVLITTKTGKPGETIIHFNGEFGMQKASKTVPRMNSDQFADLFIDAFNNAGYKIPAEFDDPDFPQVNNDWQDLTLRTAPQREYNLSVTGGDQKTQFAVAGSYLNRKGILISTQLQRISLRANMDHQVNSKLKIGARLSGSHQWREGALHNQQWGQAFRIALMAKPWIPYKNEDGEWADLPPRSGATYGLVANPAAILEREIRNFTDNRFLGNVYAEYNILESLQLRAHMGTDLLFSNNYTYIPTWKKGGNYNSNTGSVSTSNRNQYNWIVDPTLTYDRQFGNKHHFKGLLGLTVQQFDTYNEAISASGTTNDNLREISNQPNISNASGGENKVGLVSYYARLNYDYNNKYLLTATVRRDGSSRFGSANRYGTFPSAAIGWRISEESFMQGFNFLEDLKLRVSYGLTGNQQIGDFRFLARTASRFYVWGDNVAEGNAPISFSNPDLQWESEKQFDVGVNAAMLNNRISLTADYYQKVSDNLLVNIPVPHSNGITNFQTVNLGSVRNRGVEFGFNTRNLVGDFKWTTDFNITTNANKVLDIGTNAQGEPLEIQGRGLPGSIGSGTINFTKKGHPIGAFYGYTMKGIWQLDEANKAAQYGREPGDVKFKDRNGDGKIDSEDKTFLGQPQPAWYGGLTNSFKYSGITLSASLSWQTGHKIYNVERVYSENGFPNTNQRVAMINRWTKENPSNKYPKVYRENAKWQYNAQPSTRFLEDASFLRVGNISLGYNIPSRWLNELQISRAEIKLSVNNAFTFTDYSGFDPETNSDNSPLSAGIDLTPYPFAKSYILNLNISF